jgi:hypothetical protein
MRLLLITLLLVIGVTLLGRPASAAEQQIQVLALGSPDAFENARALTGALRRAVLRSEGWTLASGDFSLEVLAAALDCPEPPDAGCLEQIARKMGAERFIWGTVHKKSKTQVVAHLRLWQDGKNEREVEFDYSSNLNDEADDMLLELAQGALSQLLGEAKGTLSITAGTVDGQVTVNGQPAGTIRNGRAKLRVPSGKLRVRVKAAGYRDLQGSVVVPPGAEATLALNPVATEQDAPTETESPLAQPEAEAAQPSDARKVWGFASLGVGVAALATGAVFWVQSYSQTNDPVFERYVNQTPRNQDPCERARTDPSAVEVVEICDANVTSRTMAYVLVPLGVGLSALGTMLLLSSDSEASQGVAQAGSLSVRPLVGVGPTGGRLDLRATF